jgi:hypothetical protein
VTDPDRRLSAQLAWLRSDERLRRQAAAADEATPEERLRIAESLCAAAAVMLERQPPEARARLETTREPVTASAAAALKRLSGR